MRTEGASSWSMRWPRSHGMLLGLEGLGWCVGCERCGQCASHHVTKEDVAWLDEGGGWRRVEEGHEGSKGAD